MKLRPKEAHFFSLFDRMVETAEESASELARFCQDLSEPEAKAAAIKRLEREADVVVHEISKRLSASVVAPFEREDVISLARSLDDIVDEAEATSDRLVLYELTDGPPELAEMAGLLLEAVREVRGAVLGLRELADVDDILKRCLRINELETQCDAVQRRALRHLFDGRTDALGVIKWKEVLDRLEAATDRCEDVANVLETVVVKHAAQ